MKLDWSVVIVILSLLCVQLHSHKIGKRAMLMPVYGAFFVLQVGVYLGRREIGRWGASRAIARTIESKKPLAGLCDDTGCLPFWV